MGIFDIYQRDVPRMEDWPQIWGYAKNQAEEEKIKNILFSVHNHEELKPLVEILKRFECIPRLYFSEEKKTYESILKKYGKGDDKTEWAHYPVLGEYNSEYKSIILYYYNIVDSADKDGVEYLTVMRYVYLHELMHKYFDRECDHKYNLEIEEPLAEFGALYCLNQLVTIGIAEKEELEWAITDVERKDGPIKAYSYGAALYKGYIQYPDAQKNFLINYK